jgi:hypothetical protein
MKKRIAYEKVLRKTEAEIPSLASDRISASVWKWKIKSDNSPKILSRGIKI